LVLTVFPRVLAVTFIGVRLFDPFI
jgi:hypothetical protein